MERFTDDFKIEAVKYYYTKAGKSKEETCSHFNIGIEDFDIQEWKPFYAKEAVHYQMKNDISISKTAQEFGVDHSTMVYWIHRYKKELCYTDEKKCFNAQEEIMKLREDVRTLKAELNDLKKSMHTGAKKD